MNRINIIPRGVLHRNKNKLPKSLTLGKKGIPVVETVNKELVRYAEIEEGELIIGEYQKKKLDEFIEKIEMTNNEELKKRFYILLGKFITNEVINNTKDFSKIFKKR